MSSPGPPPGPRPRGTHRAASSSQSLLIPVVLVAAVIAAIGLATWMLLASPGDDAAFPTGTPTPAGGTSTGASPSKSPSASPSKSATKSASPSKSPTKSSKPSPTKSPTDRPVPSVPVYVFNQTTVTGLAASFSRVLDSDGWTVAGVGNWRGFVPSNTVYYWPGDKAAAQRLSSDYGEIGRVWPASSPMPRDGLVVILASDLVK